MNRASWALVPVIALELIAAVFWSRAAHAPNEAPQPDLGILDALTAAEVRSRQERVRKENSPESWTDLATIYLMYGYFNEADTCCRRSAALRPSLMNNFWWGTTLSRLGRLEESTERFRAAVTAVQPSQGDLCWYCIGLNLLRQEQSGEAESAFRKAAGFPSAEYELAKLLVRSGRIPEAVPLLEKLTRDNPQLIRNWQLRASAAEALGDLKQAEDFRDRADRAPAVYTSDELTAFLERQIEKHGLDAQIQRGKLSLDAGRLPEAAQILRSALALEWRPLAADLLADIELNLGHPDESIRILTEAMTRFSATPARLIALGDAWRAKGNSDEAVRLWERAAGREIARFAHARLAEHYAQVGDQPRAVRHRALAAHADGLEAYRQDRVQDAAKAFANAVELAPDHAHSWFYLGECRRVLNEPAPAAEAYRRCLEINRYHGRARRALERLTS